MLKKNEVEICGRLCDGLLVNDEEKEIEQELIKNVYIVFQIFGQKGIPYSMGVKYFTRKSQVEREELSSNMKRQDQSQQSLENKDDNIEEHFKVSYACFSLIDSLN